MCQTAYWSTITHTQVRARNSAQPSARSARKRPSASPRSCSGGRMASSAAALTTNVPASVARAAPGPATAITAPPRAGPSTEPPECAIARSAFARWRSGGLTVCGTRPVEAGLKNAAPTPCSETMATKSPSGGSPEITATASTPVQAARRASAASMTRRRESRSDHTPPTSMNATRATMLEA